MEPTFELTGMTPDGQKTPAELIALQNLLKEEAILFITQNSENLFKLGKQFVEAILFNEADRYAQIPEIIDQNDLAAIVEKERILTARSKVFQLVAKAELENYQTYLSVKHNAQMFLLSILKKAGTMGATYLLKLLALAILA